MSVWARVWERRNREESILWKLCAKQLLYKVLLPFWHTIYKWAERRIEQIAVGKMFSLTITHIDFMRTITTTTMARTTTTTTPMKTQRRTHISRNRTFVVCIVEISSCTHNASTQRHSMRYRIFVHSSPFHRWIKKKRCHLDLEIIASYIRLPQQLFGR